MIKSNISLILWRNAMGRFLCVLRYKTIDGHPLKRRFFFLSIKIELFLVAFQILGLTSFQIDVCRRSESLVGESIQVSISVTLRVERLQRGWRWCDTRLCDLRCSEFFHAVERREREAATWSKCVFKLDKTERCRDSFVSVIIKHPRFYLILRF